MSSLWKGYYKGSNLEVILIIEASNLLRKVSTRAIDNSKTNNTPNYHNLNIFSIII